MIIKLLRGGKANCLAITGGSETKGLATPGGVVSPSISQKKLSILLAVMTCFKLRRYGE
jgi:ribosomal protein S6E (S10)